MIIMIEINNGLTGYRIEGSGGKISRFEDLSRSEQIKVMNSFFNGYELVVGCLKKEE